MDHELVREKLRLMTQIVAEIQAMLPDEPPRRPHLVVVKNGDYDIGDSLQDMIEPSRVREGFHILGEKGAEIVKFPGMKEDSEANARKAAIFYTQEEIDKLPRLRDGRYRLTSDGLHQIRYRREGFNVQFTSKDKKTVEKRFREWVRNVNDESRDRQPNKTETFEHFASRYFEKVKSVNVEAQTCEDLKRQAQRHIYPIIGKLKLRQISPLRCQEVLLAQLEANHGRTAETLKNLLNEILRAAVGEHLIRENPMDFVKIPKHERELGVSLTLEEVHTFIKACERSPYQRQLMLLLYTGIRRGELKSAVIENDFVTVRNGKCRKGHRVTFRRIPIAEGLRAYLPLSAADLAVKGDVLTRAFKKICPDHQLKDLRHTFTTHTIQCGIPKELVDVWTAHVDKKDMTTSVYTHFSVEYQLEMMLRFHL